mmetsp:Transcript_6372/g.14088  ORF Transcript_6372/g.14088 Transcript_6372/m.14088 type:complete len:210 (+) Transcript_6372:2870-3499(+)
MCATASSDTLSMEAKRLSASSCTLGLYELISTLMQTDTAAPSPIFANASATQAEIESVVATECPETKPLWALGSGSFLLRIVMIITSSDREHRMRWIFSKFACMTSNRYFGPPFNTNLYTWPLLSSTIIIGTATPDECAASTYSVRKYRNCSFNLSSTDWLSWEGWTRFPIGLLSSVFLCTARREDGLDCESLLADPICGSIPSAMLVY